MNVYITNVTKNMDVSIKEKTLKPGKGDVFSEEASKQEGVVAFIKKGLLKVEMIKEFPDAVVADIVPQKPPVVNEPKAAIPHDVPAVESNKESAGAPSQEQNDSGRAERKKHSK